MLDTRSRRAHRYLLLGSASAALIAALAAAPALAGDVEAIGPRTLVSQQTNIDTSTQASAADAVVQTGAASTDASNIALSQNNTAATARGNQAATTLAPDALDLASGFGPTWLTTGSDSVEASGGAVIANAQTNEGSPVRAETLGARISLDGGQVADSRLIVDTNSQEAVAFGNDAASSLALTGVAVDAGAGIASYQAADYGSRVSAKLAARVRLTADDLVASDLSLTDNLQRAIGYGNSAGNGLSVDVVGLSVPSTYGLSSYVPAEGNGQPEVQAAYGVLSHQMLDANVRASARSGSAPAFGVNVAGDLESSAVHNDRNALIAAGYGNSAGNGLELEAVSIDRSGWGEGGGHAAVASVTNVQGIGDANVRAASRGGVFSHAQGEVTDSSITSSGSSVRTMATGNLADGNLLTVNANSIDVPGEGEGWGGGEIGTALLGYDDSLTASAPFSVQNAQDYGSGRIVAAQRNSDVDIVADGDVMRSSLSVDGSAAAVIATGNSAANGLTLEASSLRASADINNLQTGSGEVLATAGRGYDPAGAAITVMGDIADASLSVAGNRLTGTAVGNSAANSLSASADIIANGSGHEFAASGPQFDGYGARADFALANAQRLGAALGSEGGSAARIASTVMGGFAVEGGGAVDRSALAVEDTAQAAEALGNTAVNRIVVTATSLTDEYESAAGSALSSLQFGDADVQAISDLRIAGAGGATDSSISLSGNSNRALAVTNDADNGLIVDAVRIGALTGGDAGAGVDLWGEGGVEGDHVLGNVQNAFGSVAAVAATKVGNQDASAILDRSRFTIAGNATSAEASANRALNSVSVTAPSGRDANAGLLNSQYSSSGVMASASTDARYVGLEGNASSVALDGNNTAALALGNAADNRLALTGGSGDSFPPVPEAEVEGFGHAFASAGAVLLNGQSNDGAVTALSLNSSHGAVLTGYGAQASRASVTGNSVAADAYGNAVGNRIVLASLDRLPTAAVVNVQSNYGPVTAQVVGSTYNAISGPVTSSALGITGNQVTATAMGNQAANVIASPR